MDRINPDLDAAMDSEFEFDLDLETELTTEEWADIESRVNPDLDAFMAE